MAEPRDFDQGPAASTLRLDSRALQVLAHPLRSRLLSALRTDGPGTATALADALETNSGATSYHLRKLADVGLVIETGEGRGRERWWRAATEAHSWTWRDVADDLDGQAAVHWLHLHYFGEFVGRFSAWLEAESSWPLGWQDAAGSQDRLLSLSARQLVELRAELGSVLDRYREPDPHQDADVQQVGIFIHAFPRTGSRR